jgi:hypothetical protein
MSTPFITAEQAPSSARAKTSSAQSPLKKCLGQYFYFSMSLSFDLYVAR